MTWMKAILSNKPQRRFKCLASVSILVYILFTVVLECKKILPLDSVMNAYVLVNI
jgi:hypothetical protein